MGQLAYATIECKEKLAIRFAFEVLVDLGSSWVEDMMTVILTSLRLETD